MKSSFFRFFFQAFVNHYFKIKGHLNFMDVIFTVIGFFEIYNAHFQRINNTNTNQNFIEIYRLQK